MVVIIFKQKCFIIQAAIFVIILSCSVSLLSVTMLAFLRSLTSYRVKELLLQALYSTSWISNYFIILLKFHYIMYCKLKKLRLPFLYYLTFYSTSSRNKFLSINIIRQTSIQFSVVCNKVLHSIAWAWGVSIAPSAKF